MGHFLPFDPPNYTKDQNFEKLKKNAQRYYHFTLVYHKQRSYDISFLRHQARQTNFFVILGYFLFFNSPPPTKQKIKYLKKCALLPPPPPPKKSKFQKNKKKHLEVLSFYTCVPQMTIIKWDKVQRTNFFVILGHFLPFYPHNNPENQNFEKNFKKILQILSYYMWVP